MQENDHTAIEPDDSVPAVEDQTPPPGYEPQVELSPDQAPGIVERDGVTIDDVEEELDNNDGSDLPDDGVADDGDDDAEDGEPGDSD